MTKVSFIPTKEPKILELVQPYELLNSEGPILTVYFKQNSGYGDLYIQARSDNSGDYLLIKVDHLKLLAYLNNEIALQEVIYSCNESVFIYQLMTSKCKSMCIEMPVDMFTNYRLSYAENRISQVPDDVLQQRTIQPLLDNLNKWIKFDPFEEEDWFEGDQKIAVISIDASIYFSLKH